MGPYGACRGRGSSTHDACACATAGAWLPFGGAAAGAGVGRCGGAPGTADGSNHSGSCATTVALRRAPGVPPPAGAAAPPGSARYGMYRRASPAAVSSQGITTCPTTTPVGAARVGIGKSPAAAAWICACIAVWTLALAGASAAAQRALAAGGSALTARAAALSCDSTSAACSAAVAGGGRAVGAAAGRSVEGGGGATPLD
jgi:hypothetical protein